jgi:hypothetical protein
MPRRDQCYPERAGYRTQDERRAEVLAKTCPAWWPCHIVAGMTTSSPPVSQALVVVYSRPDAYYVVTSKRTTAGIWVHSGPADMVSSDDDVQALANAVAAAMEPDALVVRHPAQDHWTEWRRQALGPLLRQAQVRSWKAFVLPAALVTIHRLGRACTVTPERRDQRRVDVFHPMVEDEVELPDCTPAHLIHALCAALEAAAR